MTDIPDNDTDSAGVILRARNGDVIRFEPSGLTLRLSDRVIQDIALRLPVAPADPPARIPDGIDGWDPWWDGDWLRFTARLPGAQGTRSIRQHRDGGALVAETPGPLVGLLGLGGARAALATPGRGDFPYHVMAPADDIGAVGHSGLQTAARIDRLEPLRERTTEALVAETILAWRMAEFGPLPLFVTRVETDSAATSADLATGKALENLLIAADNLASAANAMGKRARIAAVVLDFALEDRSADPVRHRDGMLATMTAISDGLWARGFSRPTFVQTISAGLPSQSPDTALQGQWELAWSHGDHDLVTAAPGYMFAKDAYHRATDTGRLMRAEMIAHALADGADWSCPVLHLAEWNGADLTVTAQAMAPLCLDADDPLAAGDGAGFALGGTSAQITSVRTSGTDPKALILSLSAPPEPGTTLRYAADGPGALRDTWTADSATGIPLHRWALPAILPITGVRDARA